MTDYKKWDPTKVKAWIKNQNFPPNIESDAMTTLGTCKGDKLDQITTKQHLMVMGIKPVYCRAILKAIEKLKQDPESGVTNEQKQENGVAKEQPQDNVTEQPQDNVSDQRTQDSGITNEQKQESDVTNEQKQDDDAINPQLFADLMKEHEEKYEAQKASEFYVMFDVNASNVRKSRKKFKLTDTMFDLKQYWVEQEEGGNISDLVLIFNAKQYSSENNAKTLQEIGMTAQNNFVSTLVKLQGGITQVFQVEDENTSAEDVEDALRRERIANFKNNKIKPSLKEDCLMGYDERKLRVRMPCGHVFAPLTIYQLTQRVFEKLNQFEVRCPMDKCDQLWTFDVLVAGGGFNASESCRFQRIFNKREAISQGDTQECPNCKTLTQRPDDLTMQRVRCKNNQCKNANDFCWVCGKSWIGGGYRVCGNEKCSTGLINDQLKNSPMTKTMWSFQGVEIPMLRACPNCFAKIQHNEHCKHMKCIHCKTEFCFVCLEKKIDGKWQCGSYGDQCKLAPIQQVK